MKDNYLIKVGVLIVNEGKLLLIKEKNGNDRKYYWNFVKGTFEVKKDVDFFCNGASRSRGGSKCKD